MGWGGGGAGFERGGAPAPTAPHVEPPVLTAVQESRCRRGRRVSTAGVRHAVANDAMCMCALAMWEWSAAGPGVISIDNDQHLSGMPTVNSLL